MPRLNYTCVPILRQCEIYLKDHCRAFVRLTTLYSSILLDALTRWIYTNEWDQFAMTFFPLGICCVLYKDP